MTSEVERLQQIISNKEEGEKVSKYVYDELTKKIRPASPNDDPNSTTQFTQEDRKFFNK